MKTNGLSNDIFNSNLELRETGKPVSESIADDIVERVGKHLLLDDYDKDAIRAAVMASLKANAVLFTRCDQYSDLWNDITTLLGDEYYIEFENYVFSGVTEDVAQEAWNHMISTIGYRVEINSDANYGTWDNIEHAIVTLKEEDEDFVEEWNMFLKPDNEEGE